MKKILFALAAGFAAPLATAGPLVFDAPQTASAAPAPAPVPKPFPSGSKLALGRKFPEISNSWKKGKGRTA